MTGIYICMRKTLIVIAIIIIFLLPLVLLFISNPKVSLFLAPLRQSGSNKAITVQKYSAVSEVTGYTIKLVDTKYLDYLTESMGIFDKQAIVDPRIYLGFKDIKTRYTVSRIRFVLAPKVDSLMVALSGKKTFLGIGEYRIEGDTLVLPVSLDFVQLTTGPLAAKLALEDTYLRAVGMVLYYAHGITDNETNVKAFTKLKSDIQEYLYAGIFPWSIQITAVKS
jgi:hypothetical protein